MKNNVWILVLLILGALVTLEFRYALVVNSPIVAKIDRLTGDVWVANSGIWLKVNHPAKQKKEKCPVMVPGYGAKTADKAAPAKAT